LHYNTEFLDRTLMYTHSFEGKRTRVWIIPNWKPKTVAPLNTINIKKQVSETYLATSTMKQAQLSLERFSKIPFKMVISSFRITWAISKKRPCSLHIICYKKLCTSSIDENFVCHCLFLRAKWVWRGNSIPQWACALCIQDLLWL